MRDFRAGFDALYRRMQSKAQIHATRRMAAAPLNEILAVSAPAKRAVRKPGHRA